MFTVFSFYREGESGAGGTQVQCAPDQGFRDQLVAREGPNSREQKRGVGHNSVTSSFHASPLATQPFAGLKMFPSSINFESRWKEELGKGRGPA